MDSGSTILAFVLAASALAFLGLHAGVAAMPLLRRAGARGALPESGARAAAARRLRAGRQDYEELISLLLMMSAAAISASALALFIRLFSLPWPAVAGALTGLWTALLLLVPLVKYLMGRLSPAQLATTGVVAQAALLPLLPARRFFRAGLRFTGSDQDAEQSGAPGAEPAAPALDVHEEIAEEPLERHEEAMIRAILHLDKTLVREIMVPRVDIVSVEANAGVERAAARMLDAGHSRLPVYRETPDSIAGVLYSRDLLADASSGGLGKPLDALMRPAFFVPETKRVDEMLQEFQERRVHMAIVIDEYGSLAGLVTIEDLLEEIVGEIEDEFDKGQPDIQRRGDGTAVVEGKMSVDDFNAAFGAAVEGEGFDSVGGLMFARLGKVPAVGDVARENGLELRVLTTTGRRVRRVLVSRPVPDEPDPSGESAA